MALVLVTFDDIKKLMVNLTGSSFADQPALEVINGTMIDAFEQYLGRQLNSEQRTLTKYVGRFGVRQLYLPGIPVTAVVSVTVTTGGDDESWTEDDEYEITNYGLRLFTAVRNGKIVVVYTGGLTAVTAEPQLNRAALYQVTYEFQRKDHIGAETVSNEGGTVTWPELGLLKETKRMIQHSMHPLHRGGQ